MTIPTSKGYVASIVLLLLFAPFVQATAPAARTYYLVPASDGVSDETPGDRGSGPTDGRQVESIDGAPIVAQTPFLTSALYVARTGSVHLHLADRDPILPMNYTTQVQIILQNETGQSVKRADGSTYALAASRTTTNGSGEGWDDIHIDVNDDGTLASTEDAVIVPAGHRLVLAFGLVSERNAGGLGQSAASVMRATADAADDATVPGTDIHIIPGREETADSGIPFVNRTDVRENATEAIRAFGDATGRNLDSVSSGFSRVPASTVRLDDAGSWLRVATVR